MGTQLFTFIIILVSILSSYFPELYSFFIFDRSALIRGEVWRIFTCHFVHFSSLHLVYNLFVFGIAGYIIRKKNYPHFGWLCLWLSFAISISLFILKPNMHYYGGLSGVACGALYYCALMGFNESRPWQTICFLVILLLPIKMIVEIYSGASILPYWEYQSFIPMQTSHIIGCLAAAALYLREYKRRNSLTNQLKGLAITRLLGS